MPQDHDMPISEDEELVATEAVVRKPRAPRYDVYRFGEDAVLGTDIAASNDREAILEAVKGLPEDEQYGQFLVGLAGHMRLKTRERKVIPETVADDWK